MSLPLVLALLLAAPLSGEASTDPTIHEVLRMLRAGVSDSVVQRWIEDAPPPAEVSPDALVALTEAGASETLIVALMDRAPAPSSPPSTSPSQPESLPSQTSAPEGGDDAAASVTEVSTSFRVAYDPDYGEDEDRWDLFVYLDGQLLVWLPSGSTNLLGGRTVTLERRLEPGPHNLRVLRERHERRTRAARWRHEARVAPVDLPFEIGSGDRVQVALEYLEPRFAMGKAPGPISLLVRDQDEDLLRLERVGPPFSEWPALCEEVEANLVEGKKPSRADRDELESCRRWDSLWPAGAPSRDEIRQGLEEKGYEPAPAGIVGS